MKSSNTKRITLTLGIALVVAIAFFTFQFFVRQVSMPVAIVGAGIVFVLTGSLPICFFVADKVTAKKQDNEDKK